METDAGDFWLLSSVTIKIYHLRWNCLVPVLVDPRETISALCIILGFHFFRPYCLRNGKLPRSTRERKTIAAEVWDASSNAPTPHRRRLGNTAPVIRFPRFHSLPSLFDELDEPEVTTQNLQPSGLQNEPQSLSIAHGLVLQENWGCRCLLYSRLSGNRRHRCR